MGLYCFSSPRGLLPVLLVNIVVSVALLKNMVRSFFVLIWAGGATSNSGEDSSNEGLESSKARRVSITRYASLCRNRCSIGRTMGGAACTCGGNGHAWPLMECCVCLCRFEAEEEVSELSCKHFFHKGCLEKWFDNQHSTCPLCRSTL